MTSLHKRVDRFIKKPLKNFVVYFLKHIRRVHSPLILVSPIWQFFSMLHFIILFLFIDLCYLMENLKNILYFHYTFVSFLSFRFLTSWHVFQKQVNIFRIFTTFFNINIFLKSLTDVIDVYLRY